MTGERGCGSEWGADRTCAEERFRTLGTLFAAARRRSGEPADRRLTLAGAPVRLDVIGPELDLRIGRPFAHLAVRSGPEPELRIDLWSVAETGVDPPDAPGGLPGHRWSTGIGDLAASADAHLVGYATSNVEAWLDRGSRRLVGYVRDPAKQSLFERGKPLLFPLSTWHLDRGATIAHAGLLARGDEGGLLLPGSPGAGKSTTSVACALAGLAFLGDDHVAVSHDAAHGWMGHSLYGTAWLEPDHLGRFGSLRERGESGPPPPDDKRLLFVGDLPGARLGASAPIRAVVVPRVAMTDESRFARIPAIEAARSASLATLSGVVPRPGPAELERLARLASAVPCYRLDIGRHVEGIPAAVHRLLDEVCRS